MFKTQEEILEICRQKGAIRPQDIQFLGASAFYHLQRLVSSGQVIKSGRGLYMCRDFEITRHHTMVEAVLTQRKGVVCLLSALSFHEIGTQLPHQIWLAVPKGTRVTPKRKVPIKTITMSPLSFEAGIETHVIEGVEVKIYGVAKTIADCFKFRYTVGLEAAIEALREALWKKKCTRTDIMKYAKIIGIDKVMRPYLETLSV